MKNKGYVCVMEYTLQWRWTWFIRTYNGHTISLPIKFYKNKSQCRNVGKKFADSLGIEWREE